MLTTGNKYKLSYWQTLTLLAVLAAVLVVGGFALWYQADQKSDVRACSLGGEQALVHRALEGLEAVDSDGGSKLAEAAGLIASAEQYSNDIDCLYPLVLHYLQQGDYEAAQRNYDELLSLSGQGQLLSEVYVNQPQIDRLQERIDHLKTYRERVEGNTLTL